VPSDTGTGTWLDRTWGHHRELGSADEIRGGSLRKSGDVEPCVAVGRELLRRGHDVQLAVPPNMLDLIESAGLAAVAYGPDSQAVEGFGRLFSKIDNPFSKIQAVTESRIG
jgi:hypothetical protein